MEQCPECLQECEEDSFVLAECGVAICFSCAQQHECSVCSSEETESEYEPSELSPEESSCGDSAASDEEDEEE